MPILFVFLFDRAAALWFGTASPQNQLVDSATGDPGAGTGLAATWRSRLSGAAAHGAQQQRAGNAQGGTAEAWVVPSAMAVLLFGLGVAGVLFDVFLTYNSRHPLQ